MYRLLTIKKIYNQSNKVSLLFTKQNNFISDRTKTTNFTTRRLETYPKYYKNNLLVVTNFGRELGNRNQSSTTTPTNSNNIENINFKSKNKIRKNVKYVELLEVTNLKTTETKTKVKKLKAKKLSDFILKSRFSTLGKALKNHEKNKLTSKAKIKKVIPSSSCDLSQPIEYQKVDIDMIESSAMNMDDIVYDDRPLVFVGKESCKVIDNPNNVEKIMNSLYRFKESIENFETEDQDVLEYSNEVKLDDEKILEDVIDPLDVDLSTEKRATTSKIKSKKELRYKSKYHKSLEQEKLAKHKSIIINLKSYINVCVSTGNLNRALSTLLLYRQKAKKEVEINTDLHLPIKLYNIILHGYAEKGAIDKIHMIYTILKEDNIKLNYQSYAAIFECIGRLEQTEQNVNLLKKFKNEANLNEITLNDIVDKSKFQFNQCDIVVDAIKQIEPNFEPKFTEPKLHYSNSLLTKLNQNNNEMDYEKVELSEANVMNSKLVFTKLQLQNFAKEQLKIELHGSITIKSIEKSLPSENCETYRGQYNELENLWKIQIINSINRDLNTLRAQIRYKPHGVMTYYTYLKALDINQYADIILKEIRSIAEGSETYSPTVNQLYRELGRKVQARFQIEQKKRNGVLAKMGDIYTEYCSKWEDSKTNDNSRQMWQKLVHKNKITGPSMNLKDIVWPNNVLNGVGRFLYNILMRDIKVDANLMRSSNKPKTQNLIPAFYTLFRNQGRIVKEEVKPHPVLARLLRASQQQTLTFDANLVPMLCPPQPWSTPVNGGYLLTKSELIRLPQQAVQQWARINSSMPEQLYPALDSLNQLSSVPWRVNTNVLDIILEVFNKGGDPKLEVPQPPSSLPSLPVVPIKDPNISNTERSKLFKQKMQHRRKQAEMYSLWCDTLYRLSLANHFRDKTFWLPHNMDFRGRVYPIPPHLNHLGSDLARSMLIFAEPQPLGIDGFNWLKLHCINLTGLKKRNSVRERLLFAEETMDDILDSAQNPLNGKRWWIKSDEPWQTLACCIEIAKVSRSPDPAAYMSHFPIHQDGSCNGLQHYAALGRDKAGALSVNLAPSTIPQDVYSTVASLVEKTRETDAENGLQVAKILDGYVRRKVIKQTVMTTVYGVTRYGARLQIARQLKDLDEFPKEWVWPASTYLTTKTFESLREMFTSTKEIQDWFTDCARLISAVCCENVEWVTPLGLPVVQPYNRQETKSYKSNNGIRVSDVISMDMYEKPNVMKQKNAFPPNFIHSLDSSHMMLTSLFCERKGLTFISVHDCFWTHANTVPDMNKICREQFVALHSQPILEDLSKFLVNKYSFNNNDLTFDGSIYDLTKRRLNRTLQQLPDKGDFKLEKVLKSVYFFS